MVAKYLNVFYKRNYFNQLTLLRKSESSKSYFIFFYFDLRREKNNTTKS